jgi:hypothetical protein
MPPCPNRLPSAHDPHIPDAAVHTGPTNNNQNADPKPASAKPAHQAGQTHLKSTPRARATHPKSTDASKTPGNASAAPILRLKLL